jgi:hypothetical protein
MFKFWISFIGLLATLSSQAQILTLKDKNIESKITLTYIADSSILERQVIIYNKGKEEVYFVEDYNGLDFQYLDTDFVGIDLAFASNMSLNPHWLHATLKLTPLHSGDSLVITSHSKGLYSSLTYASFRMDYIAGSKLKRKQKAKSNVSIQGWEYVDKSNFLFTSWKLSN